MPLRLRFARREKRFQNGDRRHRSVCCETRSAIITLLLRARRFNATLADGEGVPFAALARREEVAAPISCGLVRLSYLAPDITKAILDGRQPGDLTAEKLLEHSRCRLPGTDQRIVLGFA